MELVDLRHLSPSALEELLEEEVRGWRERLRWNFRPSADLVLRYVGMHALDGLALIEGGRAEGYTYFVAEERKGLVGDLYVSNARRTEETERRLLEETVEAIFRAPAVRRVEAQLMMMGGLAEGPAGARAHLRRFLVAPLGGAGRLAERDTPQVLYEPWTMRWMDGASHLIAEVYAGHVDSRINDQYQSTAGARRFLQNIVQYPGCGQFHAPASWVALEAATGRLAGVSLASVVADQVGHITQICVAPWMKGRGAGYELLRRTMKTLLLEGCREVTLTVTDENRHAIELYERVGFGTLTSFDAYVWGD
jgi:ribosomal protein S18 acetylase RimI-like enzyme